MKSSTGAAFGNYYAEKPCQRLYSTDLCGRHFLRNGGALVAAKVV